MNLDCPACDGTGRQTRRTTEGIWRYPVACGGCHGTGLCESELLKQVSYVLDFGCRIDEASYLQLLRALRLLNRVKRFI